MIKELGSLNQEIPPLSFEEFRRQVEDPHQLFPEGQRPAQYGDFFTFFVDSPENPKRVADSLKRLQEENPELEQRLTKRLTEAWEARERGEGSVSETARGLERDLYDAYLIMRRYESDRNLFA